jgi:hypothetical protein
VNVTRRHIYPWERDHIPILREGGWAPGPVWTGAENLAPPGFDPRTVQPMAHPKLQIPVYKRTCLRYWQVSLCTVLKEKSQRTGNVLSIGERSRNHCVYVFWVCVCSISYPARKAHAPYYIAICSLSGSTIFFHIISTNRVIFGRKSLNIKCVLIFSTNFA